MHVPVGHGVQRRARVSPSVFHSVVPWRLDRRFQRWRRVLGKVWKRLEKPCRRSRRRAWIKPSGSRGTVRFAVLERCSCAAVLSGYGGRRPVDGLAAVAARGWDGTDSACASPDAWPSHPRCRESMPRSSVSPRRTLHLSPGSGAAPSVPEPPDHRRWRHLHDWGHASWPRASAVGHRERGSAAIRVRGVAGAVGRVLMMARQRDHEVRATRVVHDGDVAAVQARGPSGDRQA